LQLPCPKHMVLFHQETMTRHMLCPAKAGLGVAVV